MNTNNELSNKKTGLAKAAAIVMFITAALNVIDADRALEKLYDTLNFEICFLLYVIGGICLVLGFLLTGMTILSDNLNQYTKRTAIFIVIGYLVNAAAEFAHSWFFTLPTIVILVLVAILLLLQLGKEDAKETEKGKKFFIICTEILMVISIILVIVSEPNVVSQFVGGNLIFMIIEFLALILFEMYLSKIRKNI